MGFGERVLANLFSPAGSGLVGFGDGGDEMVEGIGAIVFVLDKELLAGVGDGVDTGVGVGVGVGLGEGVGVGDGDGLED